MINHEAKSSILFRHWLKAHPFMTCTFEMKDSKGKNYINFEEVKEAQLDYGRAIKGEKGVLLRMQAVSEGMPDYAYFRNSPAFIVIKYPRSFELIDVDTFILEKSRTKHKSLTCARAKELSTVSIKL